MTEEKTTEEYKKKFPARGPKPNRTMPCGCEEEEGVDEPSGYFVWKIVKPCEGHKNHESN